MGGVGLRVMRILRRGEVVLPKEVRNRLGWEAGDLLVPEVDGDRLVHARVAPEALATALEGDGSQPGPPPDPLEAMDLTAEESRLLRELGDLPLHPNQLCIRSGLPVGKVRAAMTSIEVTGLLDDRRLEP